ncbi:MAG TPA: hypothetical protein VKV28_12485 [Candidatus Binataceae bacterium]|nr:hypothetical protein [Candidatus Binataceae bacterium]
MLSSSATIRLAFQYRVVFSAIAGRQLIQMGARIGYGVSQPVVASR